MEQLDQQQDLSPDTRDIRLRDRRQKGRREADRMPHGHGNRPRSARSPTTTSKEDQREQARHVSDCQRPVEAARAPDQRPHRVHDQVPAQALKHGHDGL